MENKSKSEDQSTGIFSSRLLSELSSIINDEFGKKCSGPELLDIGLRVAEFVALVDLAKQLNQKGEEHGKTT